MEYQKIINLLNNKNTQPYSLRTKTWVETNYDRRGTSNIKTLTSRLQCQSQVFVTIGMPTYF